MKVRPWAVVSAAAAATATETSTVSSGRRAHRRASAASRRAMAICPGSAEALRSAIMPITSALLRAGLRAFNASGHLLEHLGRRPVALDEHSLLEAARRLSGRHDFGGDEFREPLAILLHGYETEARLTLLGR